MDYPPKIQKIIDYLLNQIETGELKTGKRIPSEYTLSDMFNVHKSTANRAVGCLVERGILKRQTGGGGTIVIKKSQTFPIGTIAILIPLGGVSFTAKVLDGAQMAAMKKNYALNYFQWPDNEDMDNFWKTLANSNIQGLLVFGGSPPFEMPFPVIHICTIPLSSASQNWVITDNSKGGYLVGKYLIESGHREIAFVSLNFNRITMKKRAEGFMLAMKDNGFTHPEKRIFELPLGYDNLPALIERILDEMPDVTAIAFDQDPAAARAIKYLQKKGFKIPDDISITGYGMVKEYQLDFKFTSIEQYPSNAGLTAADTLIDIIEGKEIDTPVQKTLPVDLISGETVKAFRAQGG